MKSILKPLTAAALVSGLVFALAPAEAITGGAALASCKTLSECKGGKSKRDGSITIEVGGEVIFCGSDTEECTQLPGKLTAPTGPTALSGIKSVGGVTLGPVMTTKPATALGLNRTRTTLR